MEDILASIKKVIAEEKEIRAAAPLPPRSPVDHEDDGEDVLELDEPVAAAVPEREPVDLGPPLASEEAVDSSRQRLGALQEAVASAPPREPAINPFETMVRDMVRPMLKEWLDKHLPDIVDDHVRREIGRITGTPL